MPKTREEVAALWIDPNGKCPRSNQERFLRQMKTQPSFAMNIEAMLRELDAAKPSRKGKSS